MRRGRSGLGSQACEEREQLRLLSGTDLDVFGLLHAHSEERAHHEKSQHTRAQAADETAHMYLARGESAQSAAGRRQKPKRQREVQQREQREAREREPGAATIRSRGTREIVRDYCGSGWIGEFHRSPQYTRALDPPTRARRLRAQPAVNLTSRVCDTERSADSTVLCRSMATVIGPTPPGTGEMYEAF